MKLKLTEKKRWNKEIVPALLQTLISHPQSDHTYAPPVVWTDEPINLPYCLCLFLVGYCHQETKELWPRGLLCFKLLVLPLSDSQWPPPPAMSWHYCFHFKVGLRDKFKSLFVCLFLTLSFDSTWLSAFKYYAPILRPSHVAPSYSLIYLLLFCIFLQWFVIFLSPEYW